MATSKTALGPARVGIYARISDDPDGTQTATQRQTDDCRAFAERKGWEVAEVFEDVDTVAFQPRVKRPQFERLLAAIRAGDIGGIVVWKLDRLSRQQRDLVKVMEALEPSRGFIASVTEPIDTREAYGQFVAELLVAQARMESANTSTRLRRKAQEKREQGLPPTSGIRCFGYETGYSAIRPDEANLIREAVQNLFAGRSLAGICTDWNRRGNKTTLGNDWKPQNLRALITGATISAQREYEGKLTPGSWPAIISPEETTRLRALFPGNTGRPAAGTARKYLLAGIVRCGLCGERMKGSKRADESPRYVCRQDPGYPNCGRISTLAQPVDDLVMEMIVAAVDDGALAASLSASGEREDDVLLAVRADEESLEALANDFYVEHSITREEFFSARGALTKRLEANRAKLARREARGSIGPFIGAGATLRAAWEQGSFDWKRAVITAVLDRVLIMPTDKKGRVPFDVTRVKPVWRY